MNVALIQELFSSVVVTESTYSVGAPIILLEASGKMSAIIGNNNESQ